MIKNQQLSPTSKNFKWFDITDIDETDIRELKKAFQLTPEIISYISDLNERPHYDYDEYTKSHLLVYDVPLWPTQTMRHFTTRPIVFLIHEKTVFSFHTHRTNYVFEQFKNSEMEQQAQKTTDPIELVMLFILHSTQYFQRALTQINTDRNQLDRKLNDEIANHDLRELAQIEKSLVYLSSSISTNLIMLQGLNKTPLAQRFTETTLERLDDILIESQQSSQMVKISSEVTETLSKTSNNILNNNLNDTMKFLTVWSLLLTIPTIITGFFGMNVRLPFANFHWAWIIIILLNILFMIGLFIYMKKHHFI